MVTRHLQAQAGTMAKDTLRWAPLDKSADYVTLNSFSD